MKFIALNTFKINKLVKIVLLNLIFIIYGCGEAVENIEERQRIQELSETSVITSISPSYGSTAGGDTLTIAGLNLSLVTSISLGDGICSVVSATDALLTCTTSVASSGAKNVTTINSKGKTYTFNSGYNYLAAPTITSVTPAIGSISGGETVTITGTGFYQISSITLDGVTCTSPVTASSTVATCTSGVGVAGTGDVVLTNVDTQAVTETNGYTYVNPPSITSFSPTTIIEAGSETLTITGTDFDGATASVTIDSFNCPVTFQDATTIQCTTGPWSGLPGQGSSLLSAGSDVTVVVTNGDGGSDTSTISYLPEPIISSIDIEFGDLAGGDLITLTGSYFVTGGSFNISMAGVDCATSTVVSESSATCLTDSNTAQTGDVVFTNIDGQIDTLTNGFTYRGPPTVTNVSANNGPESGGTSVTITGTGFDTSGNSTVLVGAQSCTSVVVNSATEIECDTPPNSAGLYNVTVTNTEDNQSGVGVGAFTYNPSPTITAVTTPSAPFIDYGPLAGGNTIELQGTNFNAGLSVTVDGSACTNINVVDVNTIECDAPARGSTGLVDVVVTNPDGQFFTSVGGYTYRAAPTITAVSPVAGPTGGGQTLTITGNYMRPNLDIQINGNQCPISNYINDSTIECTTPNNGGTGGPFDVIITNEDTQTATLSTAYEFINGPSITTSSPTSANPSGGSTITVTGADFYVAGGISASIDGIDCDSISNLTATSFDCVVPSHVAQDDLVISVTNLVDGQIGYSAAFFDYIPAPSLTNIYESSGTTIIDGGNVAGGYTLRLVGLNFQPGMTVDIQDDGGSIIGSCTISDIDNENADCAIAGGAYPLETIDFIFTNLDGQTSTSTNVFTFREAPTFTSITPDYGVEVAGGNTVRIVGDFFLSSAVVSIDGTDCSSTTFVDTQNLDCIVPPHAAATGLTIEIINTQDLQTTGAVGSFDYIGAPVVSSLNPTVNLWEVGGQTLTITGTELRDGATVAIDGNDCPVTGGTSPTSIECTTPAGTGTVNVLVTNADGQVSNGSLMTYLPAPTITSYDYAFGPLTGGNDITITGTGFQTGASVSIGAYGTTAITCSAVDDTGIPTTLVCTVPDGTALGLGPHDVNIINNDGQVLTDPGAFDYINGPAISSFEISGSAVTSIYEVGGQTLTVNGTDFRDGLTMTIDGNPCPVDTYTDTTLFTCTTPAGTGTAVTVVLTNLDGQVENTVPLDYLAAPTISAVQSETDVNGGKASGGENVTITGTNFDDVSPVGNTTVTIGGSTCGVSSIPNTTTIVCTQPAGSGSGDVIVTNPDGQTVTFGTQFDFYPAPSITTVSPNGGPVTTATAITITGADFRDNTVAPGGVAVEIGSGNACTGLVIVNDTTLTCTTPALAAGDYDVIVTNGDGESALVSNGYKFTAPPTISSLSIASAPESLATALTINGTGFEYYATAPSVTVDGVACTGITVVDDTQIDCTTAASSNDSTRLVDVVVTNQDGQSATDSTSLTYIARPHISGATPLFGSVAGGTVITITGTNFVAGASVTIGVPCASLDDSGVPTSLVCTTDSAAVGSYDIVVQNPDGQVDDDTIMYGYSNPPVVSSASDDFDVIAGGKTITINGSDFLGVSNVTIGGASCGTINNAGEPTSITCIAPAGTIGEQDIIVTNGDGQTDTLTDGFEYEDTPTFSAITDGVDAAGSDDGGESVTITGTNFALGVSVTIGGSSCTTLNRVNATTLTCTTPAGTIGAADVIISNQSAAATVTAVGAYTFQAEAPVVSSISPGGGDTVGGETITIIGENFQATPIVTLDGSTCTSPTFIDSQNITCVTPAHAQGFVDIVVTNPDTNTGSLTNGFLYSDKATIATISPNSGASTGGQTVTITGANFQSGLYAVNIGGVSCGSITHINTGSFTCVIGAQTSGTYDVNIEQLFQTDTLSSAFTYANGASLNWIVGASQPTPPNPADYGTTSSNVTLTFTLENNGPTTSTSITTSITGTDNTAWVIGADNCNGTTLNSGSSCTVQVTFLAAFLSTGSYSANLEATAVDGGTTINALEGETP